MKRAIRLSVLLILLLTTVTGCWSRRELNDLAIVVAIGLDKKDDRYRVSVQVVNPNEVAAKKGSGNKGAPVITYTETMDTVFEAFRKITNTAPRKLYFAHLRMMIISEQLAKEGIGRTLDFMSRDHEFRTDFFVAVARGSSAEKILNVYSVPMEVIPANKMFKTIQTSSTYWAETVKVTIDDLLSEIASKGKEAVLTGVLLPGDKDNPATETKENMEHIVPLTTLHFAQLAVFRKDKLIGWLDEQESKSYNYLQGKVKSTVGHITCPDGGKLGMEAIRTKSDITGRVVNGRPEIDVKLEVEENIADVECKIDLTKTETMAWLEAEEEAKLKDMLEGTVRNVQKKYKVDIFGFGEAIHRSAPGEWKQWKKDWDSEFAKLPVNIDVVVNIRRKGTITDSFLDKVKE